MATPDALKSTTPRSGASRSKARKRGWLSVLAGGLAGVVLLLLLAVGAALLWLRGVTENALPVVDGELHIPALSAPVAVRRDGHGIPHIEAANQQDLFLAQGYVTAQDRLWQMDMLRRNGAGELAEVLGASMVNRDRAQRVFRFRAVSERLWATLPAGERAPFEAYARGVNLFIEQHPNALPPEFRLLMYKPRPWTPVDSFCIQMMMVQMLDSQWSAKLGRQLVAAKLNNPKLLAELYPVGSWRDHPPTGEVIDLTQPRPAPPPSSDDDEDDRTQAGRLAPPQPEPATAEAQAGANPRLTGDLNALRATLGLETCPGCVAGSNNWVIAGKHTASGKPLLSNDMHLVLLEPNIWYMVDLKAPGFHAAGVALPGIPFVIAGHNEHVAWGFTTLMGDVQDLYVEKLDGKGNYQAADGSWKPLKIDHETIHVRGGNDVNLVVETTDHGPLLNPLLPHATQPLALKWTLYDPALTGSPIEEMNKAASCADFSTAVSRWNYPTQNVVYADDQGHIAYHAIGKVPIRPAGLNAMPIVDWEGNNQREWSGYVPFEGMPNAFDPPSGFLATANSRVTTDRSPYPISLEWVDPYRAERIYKSLQGRDGLTPKDMLAVQTDVYSEVDQEIGHRLAYAIDHTPSADERLRKAADLMRSWDGKLTVNSAAASLVTQARAALWPLILDPKLGDARQDYHWAEKDFAEEEIIMHGSSDWLPPASKNWDAVLTDAVRQGMDNGKAPSDVSRWNYGSWHVVDIEHPLADLLPFVSRIAGTGPQPLSGDTTTVKQVGRAFGPSQRFTMDWSNVDGSTEDIVLGESGNPFSPYFRDQWKDYYGGTTFALPFSETVIAGQASHTLRLVP